MKLLVLSPFPYHAKVSHGGGVVCYQQLQMLAREHEVHYLGFVVRESEEEVQAANADLAALCRSVQMVRLDLGRAAVWRARLAFLTRWQPIDAALLEDPAMSRALAELMQKIQPDLVLLQFPQVAQYVDRASAAATVVDVGDAYSVSAFRRYRNESRPLHKAKLFFNWLAWLRYESRYYPRFDAVIALTSQDRVALEVFNPGLGADAIPAAVHLPDEVWSAAAAQPDTLAFLGSFGHYPNVEAVRYLITDVLPLIHARRPGVKLLIAGANAPPALQALAGEHVAFLGFVPDAAVFMRSAAVIVAPLQSGGGIKIKVLEAMASACPLVTTSIGAEETGAVHGEHALISDQTQEFAEHVLTLLENPEQAQQLGSKARALVQQRFSWPAKQGAFKRVFAQALARRRAR